MMDDDPFFFFRRLGGLIFFPAIMPCHPSRGRLAHATRQDRMEFTLPMDTEVTEALNEMVRSVGGVLESFVGCAGRLVDLSCMISDPNCEFQPLHADTSMERVKFTVFVALQDVTAEMGPTFLCPETHNFESHSALDAMKKLQVPHQEMLDRFGAVPALCKRGDIVIMKLCTAQI